MDSESPSHVGLPCARAGNDLPSRLLRYPSNNGLDQRDATRNRGARREIYMRSRYVQKGLSFPLSTLIDRKESIDRSFECEQRDVIGEGNCDRRSEIGLLQPITSSRY